MTEAMRIAVDTTEPVFTIHAIDGRDHPESRRNLERADMLCFFIKHAPMEVVLEACGGSHQ